MKKFSPFFRKIKINLEQLNLNELTREKKTEWLQRIENVKASEDNNKIPRHNKAGKIINGNLIMHNGIKIKPLSYGGYAMLRLLMENKGVHEPEQEVVFQDVLNKMQKKATMIELGSYWAFYSLWFCEQVPDAQCILIEPNPTCLKAGKRNFKINGHKGKFIQGAIGEYNSRSNVSAPKLSLDCIIQKNKLRRIDILHADIQGQELNMLTGGHKAFSNKLVQYVFLSTHSAELHASCEKQLRSYSYYQLKSIPPSENSSYDGLIVMTSESPK